MTQSDGHKNRLIEKCPGSYKFGNNSLIKNPFQIFFRSHDFPLEGRVKVAGWSFTGAGNKDEGRFCSAEIFVEIARRDTRNLQMRPHLRIICIVLFEQ